MSDVLAISEHTRLTAAQVRWSCPMDWIPAETTEGVEPMEGIIGQDRAVKALKMGVEIEAPGYNVFVCGLSGTGKATTIKRLLEKIQAGTPPPFDYAYVYNFEDEDRPVLLRFPRGDGARFRTDVREAVQEIVTRIPRIYEDSETLRRKQAVIEEYNARETELFAAFEKGIAPDGFVLGRVQEGQGMRPELLVRLDDQVMLISDLDAQVQQGKLTQEQADVLRDRYRTHRAALQDTLRAGIQLSKEYQKLIADQEQEIAWTVIEAVFTDLFNRYEDVGTRDFLRRLADNMVGNLERFKPQPDQELTVDSFPEYTVNLILDNAACTDRPVIIETAPNYTNMFGTIERQQDENGFWFTDFTRIKPGSLLRADGGFLVLNAADLFTEPHVWRTLQRVLLTRKLEIQSLEMLTQQPAMVLKPEPIEISVKVILIGNNEIYSLMSNYERDFKKIFKVKADFDYEIPAGKLAVEQYSALVRKLVVEEGLRDFDNRAIGAIVEYGSRLAGTRRKLTTQFSEIADVVREANYWCSQNSSRFVTAEHVRRAITEARRRHSMAQEKLQELVARDTILIDVDGSRAGQVNGLAVYQVDRHAFGLPSRITAAVSAGKAGIINIERESRLSGSSHDKGVLVMSGFLRETFASSRPLALSASISFEQSYSGVDGDSASSTELYALLSALSGLPVFQGLAVTGSVNQKGDIQPIGGVNEKVEGFFEICREKGLTGYQGVIIPAQNVDDLMLDEPVTAAVAEGRFHIHAITRVEEGIALLTGVPAGARGPDGSFPGETVYGRVERRLADLASASQPRRKEG